MFKKAFKSHMDSLVTSKEMAVIKPGGVSVSVVKVTPSNGDT
jgi:hypothetical protein